MRAFLAVVVGLFVARGVAFSLQTPAPGNDVSEIARVQAAAEHAQAIKDYPAWLVKTIASEFAAILEAGNQYLANPNQENWERFQAAKNNQLQRAGVHICKFDEAAQGIADEERKRLGDQLAAMMDAFTKNETALEARIAGVMAEQKRGQEPPVGSR